MLVGWVTLTHTQRWHAHRHSRGRGHVYQGRFKSFVAQDDGHYFTVCRYVERNALRANLVSRAEDWPWASLCGRQPKLPKPSPGPLPRWEDWLEWVNEPQTQAELDRLRQSIARGRPFGEERWQRRVCQELGLEITLRPLGRPSKASTMAASGEDGS